MDIYHVDTHKHLYAHIYIYITIYVPEKYREKCGLCNFVTKICTYVSFFNCIKD